jgi:hypothetical protein
VKKIDLHIHTVCTTSDSPFVFSLPKLSEYARRTNLDGVAITNHNCFDVRQFREITAQLQIAVFPGIELVVDGGHLLVLSDAEAVADFDARCRSFGEAAIRLDDLRTVFGDLSRYLIIPHYDKKPQISANLLSQLGPVVSAGEVSSPKKFRYCLNDPGRLVPVIFSDIRIHEGLSTFPTRQTYIDTGDISLSSIKLCLRDKNKVFLSERDGHRIFDALDNGMKLSTGLNVILGERSTGKTYTLDRLSRDYENVKYIKQFSLLERDEEFEVKRFKTLLSQKQSLFTQEYLGEFKEAVDSMVGVDTTANERKVERYLTSLLNSAKEAERADAFSKAQLFSEVDFSVANPDMLKSLISAVESLIENREYRPIIQKHVPISALRSLLVELMSKWAQESELNLKKRWLNDLINTIRKTLRVHTAAPVVEDVDFYQMAIDRRKVERFQDVIRALRRDRQLHIREVQGFTIVARTNSFRGAVELRALSGRKIAFAEAFKSYDDPYTYLRALSEIDGLEASEFYKYFVTTEFSINTDLMSPAARGQSSICSKKSATLSNTTCYLLTNPNLLSTTSSLRAKSTS